MRNISWLFAILMSFAVVADGEEQGLKIGFVNMARVIDKAPQAADAKQALEKEFSSRDADLAADRDAIVKMEDKLSTDAEVMSESKRAELEREVRRRKREFNRAKEELKEDFNIRRNEELAKLQRDIHKVIVALGKNESYDLMVTEQVLYNSERIDITDKILNSLQETYKAK